MVSVLAIGDDRLHSRRALVAASMPDHCLLQLPPRWRRAPQGAVPPGFVDAATVVDGLVVDMRYFGDDNFVGARIDGYEASRCLLTRPAAAALARVQQDLAPQGFGLKVFDCYRPTRAVAHFVRWARDVKDVKRKADFYPDVDKRDLFRLGYISNRSGHSRGSTVDLTLVRRGPGAPARRASTWARASISSGLQSWPSSRRRQRGGAGEPQAARVGDAARRLPALRQGMVALHAARRTVSGQLFQFSGEVIALCAVPPI